MTMTAITGLLLAAGESKRMMIDGKRENKLLASLHGKPLIRHVADAITASGLDSCVTVLGHDAGRIKTALDGFSTFRFVTNPDYAKGQSSSIRCGIESITDAEAVMVLLGDMPLITAEIIDRLIAHHLATDTPQSRITLPRLDDRYANPVIWGRDFFPALAAITGDKGGRALIETHARALNALPMPMIKDAFDDADTATALDAIRRHIPS